MWDVGGQRTIRAFWRHYFECTDGLIWVVDSADRDRMKTCKEELHRLLKEEVKTKMNSSTRTLTSKHAFSINANKCKDTQAIYV